MLRQLLFLLGVILGVVDAVSPCNAAPHASHVALFLSFCCLTVSYVVCRARCGVRGVGVTCDVSGGWTSGSGSTFDLSALKLTDGSYSPAAFSDERGEPVLAP